MNDEIFAIIGKGTILLISVAVIVCIIATVVVFIKDKIDNKELNAKLERKKDIIKVIDNCLDKDIRYFDFDNITYKFECISDKHASWQDGFIFEYDPVKGKLDIRSFDNDR